MRKMLILGKILGLPQLGHFRLECRIFERDELIYKACSRD